jgi:hypothetical protein
MWAEQVAIKKRHMFFRFITLNNINQLLTIFPIHHSYLKVVSFGVISITKMISKVDIAVFSIFIVVVFHHYVAAGKDVFRSVFSLVKII